MTPEDTFHQLLGLGESWRVLRTEYEEKNNAFVICVTETEKLWEEESQKAGQRVTCYDHVEPMQWRQLNVFNKECVIVSALPRGKREADGAIYRVTPPWEGRNKHFTKEFEAFALTLMREMPVKRAGEILGETDQRMWRMVQAHVAAAYARLDMSEVIWVGADEMNRKKGHHYLTVFADLQAKRVIFATDGREAEVWALFAGELGRHNGHPKAIREVAIDMSPAYVKGVRDHFGNAQIVFDKFHVIQNANEAVEKVRRLEAQRDEVSRQRLAKTQWIWRKNPDHHTPRELERLEQMDWKHLLTATAYQMRLILQDIYQLNSVQQARKEFKLWSRWVKQTASKMVSSRSFARFIWAVSCACPY